MFERKEPLRQAWSPDEWRENERYLYGVDLFNLGYWWEAHAEWEVLWQTIERSDVSGSFLQGLIQIAAALVQHRGGRTEGARRLASKGVQKLRRVTRASKESHYMGVDVTALADDLESFLASGPEGTPPVLELVS
jgi:predicted metal-dependent hydrolase